MRRKLITALLVVLVILLLGVLYFVYDAEGAGTVTQTRSDLWYPRELTLDWVTQTSGWASCTTTQVVGQIARVTFTHAPLVTTAYDVTLKDDDGVDVLAGLGANIATTSPSKVVCPGVTVSDGVAATNNTVEPFAVHSTLDLVVTNAGNATTGSVKLIIK